MFVEEYKELLKHYPVSMRSRVRHSVLDVLSTLNANDSWLKKPRVQFLYIHHVFKDEIAVFEKLLHHLSQHHTFISYSDAVSKVLSGSIDKPYISISSDDGLKNNLDAALVLQSHGISACFFICPSMIGVSDENRITAFTKERLHFPPVEFLNWKEVELLQKQGHEIGGHTMGHVNVAQTNASALQFEIGNCYDVIEQHCGAPLHFAYPYGRYHHFNEEGRRAVFNAGFKSCASAERGCHVDRNGKAINAEDLLIRRDHIILSWPWRHIKYFLCNNSRKAGLQLDNFPYENRNFNQ